MLLFANTFPSLEWGVVASLCGPQWLFCITTAGEAEQTSVLMGDILQPVHVGTPSPFAPLLAFVEGLGFGQQLLKHLVWIQLSNR